jgi:Rod binding domain-containing protein
MAFNTPLVDTQTALQAAQSAKQPSRTRDAAHAKETAQDFEAQFLSQMIEQMFSGVGTSGLFEGGNGEKMFRSMLFEQFGKVLARAGGVGIADAVQREILKSQEVK